jgi:hypothetical protein
MAPDPDERFAIEGDPEDALRGLLAPEQAREFTVRIGEQQQSIEYEAGRATHPDSTPLYRLTEWTGVARDKDDAIEQGLAAFEAEHGERPKGQFSVHVVPAQT